MQSMEINLLSQQYKNTIYDVINNCNLPASNVYYILKDVFYDVEKTYLKELKKLSLQKQEEEQKQQQGEED